MKFRSPFDYDLAAASDEAVAFHDPVSLTVQEHAMDADINVLVARMRLTGTMPPNHRVPEYGDYTGVSDYRSALEAVEAANAHFMEIPAEVRAKFGNDPQIFLDFCSNSANLDVMREMGLAVPKVVSSVSGSSGSPSASGGSGKADGVGS